MSERAAFLEIVHNGHAFRCYPYYAKPPEKLGTQLGVLLSDWQEFHSGTWNALDPIHVPAFVLMSAFTMFQGLSDG